MVDWNKRLMRDERDHNRWVRTLGYKVSSVDHKWTAAKLTRLRDLTKTKEWKGSEVEYAIEDGRQKMILWHPSGAAACVDLDAVKQRLKDKGK